MKNPSETKIDYPDPELEEQIRATDIFGHYPTVSAAPSGVPTNYLNQIQIYTNGGTLRLYWYDVTNAAWHYVTATA